MEHENSSFPGDILYAILSRPILVVCSHSTVSYGLGMGFQFQSEVFCCIDSIVGLVLLDLDCLPLKSKLGMNCLIGCKAYLVVKGYKT